jgi:hypothetical protein
MFRLRSINVLVLVTLLAFTGATISIKAERRTTAAKQRDTPAGKAKSDGVPDTCPVTKPLEQLFVPPSPYPTNPYRGASWFGTDHLWTALPVDGTWKGLHYSPGDPTFTQKLFLWRQGYDPHTERQPKVTVTGRRLDSSAPPLLADGASNGSVQRDQPFMVVGINFPTLGCWEIKGHYQDDELTFVVWVAQ